MTIKKLVEESYATAMENGFHDHAEDMNTSYYIATKLALIHSKISEALEEVRSGHGVQVRAIRNNSKQPAKPEGLPIELADAVIRIADLCGFLGVDLDQALKLKLAYNKTRPRLHGKAF